MIAPPSKARDSPNRRVHVIVIGIGFSELPHLANFWAGFMAAPRFMLVEDDPLLGMLIADWLGEFGCIVLGPLGNAKLALEALAREGATLDGALLDVTLREGGDSYAIADALTLSGIPFVFVTGHGIGELPRRYRQSPLLTKPFQPDDLLRMVEQLVERGAS